MMITGLLVATGCSASGPGPAAVGGFGHVRGLGVNPLDGIVFAATDRGVFRLGRDRPQRIGTDARDITAFAVVGPNRFLGSGHPGPGDPGPADVGLIGSNDGALTWSPVALSGQTDFHALSAKGATVYGWDATSAAVLRSDDGGLTWHRGAIIPNVGALAVDPENTRRVLAATDVNLVESIDGGMTFAATSPQPPRALLRVDHAPRIGGGGDAVVAGVDLTGTVWTLLRGTWSPGGSMGAAPLAFTVLGPGRYVMATAAGVFATEDQGQTWKVLATTT